MRLENPGSTGFMAAFGWVFGGLVAVTLIGGVLIAACMVLCGGCLFVGAAITPTPQQMEQIRREEEQRRDERLKELRERQERFRRGQ